MDPTFKSGHVLRAVNVDTSTAGDNSVADLLDTSTNPLGMIVVQADKQGSNAGFVELVLIGIHFKQVVVNQAVRGTVGSRTYSNDGTMDSDGY